MGNIHDSNARREKGEDPQLIDNLAFGVMSDEEIDSEDEGYIEGDLDPDDDEIYAEDEEGHKAFGRTDGHGYERVALVESASGELQVGAVPFHFVQNGQNSLGHFWYCHILIRQLHKLEKPVARRVVAHLTALSDLQVKQVVGLFLGKMQPRVHVAGK